MASLWGVSAAVCGSRFRPSFALAIPPCVAENRPKGGPKSALSKRKWATGTEEGRTMKRLALMLLINAIVQAKELSLALIVTASNMENDLRYGSGAKARL